MGKSCALFNKYLKEGCVVVFVVGAVVGVVVGEGGRAGSHTTRTMVRWAEETSGGYQVDVNYNIASATNCISFMWLLSLIARLDRSLVKKRRQRL